MTAEEYVVETLLKFERENTMLKARVETLKKDSELCEKIVQVVKRHIRQDNGNLIFYLSGFFNEEDYNFLVENLGVEDDGKRDSD